MNYFQNLKMITKSRYSLVKIDNRVVTSVSPNMSVTVQSIYPYDYPDDIEFFKRKLKREQRKSKIEEIFPEFKEKT
jgi:hypothetical protein